MSSYSDLLGCKFKTHGRNKQEGFDCYGLAIEVLRREGINLPEIPYNHLDESESVYDAFFSSIKYVKIDKPEKNCIINIEYKNLPIHCGVYIGEGKFIHSVFGLGVTIEPLHAWERRVKGFYKVIQVNNI